MQTSTGKLCIQCVEVDARYTLQFEGADWSETFPTIEAAIRRAGQLVVEETQVMVYDVAGRGIVATTLFPLPGTLDEPPWVSRMGEKHAHADTLAEIKNVLASKGLRSAVEFLNSLTPHRFTSLYRFDGPTLRSLTFYDRENPSVESCEDIPVEASYCVFVRNTGQRFAVADASCDERVKDHAKRETVRRYCGVPLLDGSGRMVGSICHFDLEPGRVAEKDVELLERMAELLRPMV